MTEITTLMSRLKERFSGVLVDCVETLGEVTMTLNADAFIETCTALRDEPAFEFKELIDLCGVDYLSYGQGEWETDQATSSGFDRGVARITDAKMPEGQCRFAVVYHLLSLSNNLRLRVKLLISNERLMAPSVVDLWASANWFERETYDLYGIVFEGHPDLRRILTDYGFIGHPFRKDFPQSGYVEVRYDAKQARVVYDPVDIEPRVLVPKVIREDNRYQAVKEED